MGSRTIITLIDDLDGTEIPEGQGSTIEFALNGRSYEIDLSPKNEAKLEKALDPFIAAARQATRGRAPRSANGMRTSRPLNGTTPTTIDKDQRDHIRTWARDNGFTVSDRARIPKTVLDAYQNAH